MPPEADRGSPWILVEWANVDALDRLGEACLADSTPPYLAEDTRVGERKVTGRLGALQSDPHRTFVAFEGDEGSAVE